MSDLGPAIVTGSVAIVLAVAGFISTGVQVGRTQRSQDQAALRDEKRRAYANCIAAMHVASDAADLCRPETPDDEPPAPADDDAAEKANTELTVAATALALVAPYDLATLAMKAAEAIFDSDELGADIEARDDAMLDVIQAMRADLGLPY